MKTLATKRIYAYIVYSNLKRTPPKEYPDTNELVETVDNILPVLEVASADFVGYRKRADEINNKVGSGQLKQEDGQDQILALQKEVRVYELEKGEEVTSAEFEKAAFDILYQQFDRWGKTWFEKVEDYVGFRKDIVKANAA